VFGIRSARSISGTNGRRLHTLPAAPVLGEADRAQQRQHASPVTLKRQSPRHISLAGDEGMLLAALSRMTHGLAEKKTPGDGGVVAGRRKSVDTKWLSTLTGLRVPRIRVFPDNPVA
jgi:hypothetical protein